MSTPANKYRDIDSGDTFYLAHVTESGEALGYRDFGSTRGVFEAWQVNAAAFARCYEPVELTALPRVTWTSPAGQEFTGTPEYIVGVKTGWDARGATVPAVAPTADELAEVPWEPEQAFARPRCQHHHEHHHPNDTSTQREGEVW